MWKYISAKNSKIISQGATVVLIHNLENEAYLSGEGSIASSFLESWDGQEGEWNQCMTIQEEHCAYVVKN